MSLKSLVNYGAQKLAKAVSRAALKRSAGLNRSQADMAIEHAPVLHQFLTKGTMVQAIKDGADLADVARWAQ